MSSGGARPTHLIRRGAVYAVRFRLPAELARSLGVTEIQKSLYTADLAQARPLCIAAGVWFGATMESLRVMSAPTRADLEDAAAIFFDRLKAEVDDRQSIPRTQLREAVAAQVHLSEERIGEIDRDLISNQFDQSTDRLARSMLEAHHLNWAELGPEERRISCQLVSRAAREQMLYAIHQLSQPSKTYVPSDEVFGRRAVFVQSVRGLPRESAAPMRRLAEASALYLSKKGMDGLGGSHIQELTRALGWLEQAIGKGVPVASVTKDQLRDVRTNFTRLDVSYRGKSGLLSDRLTNVAVRQVKSATSIRYWRSVQGFFAWCEEEGFLSENHASSLKITHKKGEARDSPEPYSAAELVTLFNTPLFQGYASPRRLKAPGLCKIRNGVWWSIVLSLFTGLRAGELTQLLPSDFAFDVPFPHVKVREEDESGAKVKSAKTISSVRDVPIADILLTLGLKQFVANRGHNYPKQRIFREFRLGTNGRKSDGMTKFWGSYLKYFKLWKPGRATHVARHTIIARLRELGAAEEDIGAFVGHAGQSSTAKYGGAYPLERKAKTAATLEYGADLIDRLGGPYVDGVHRE